MLNEPSGLVAPNPPILRPRRFMYAVLVAFFAFFVMMVLWPWIALEPLRSSRKDGDGLLCDAMLSVYDPKQVVRVGDTVYDLEAQRLQIITEGSDEVLLTRLRMMATRRDGAWMTVTARAGLYNKQSRVLQLIADVRIQDARGSDLKTQSAVVRLDQRKAEGYSRISGRMGKSIDVVAAGFRLREGFAYYEFLGETEMVIGTNTAEQAG
ncbi:MAG: LPS export ABC transporter periplasmic protein LptC [Alphaproteobacteria bacterium]|nr:LPS export ABC transporter periplasmic protein LptC [Alphaproteobacteria bacterium]